MSELGRDIARLGCYGHGKSMLASELTPQEVLDSAIETLVQTAKSIPEDKRGNWYIDVMNRVSKEMIINRNQFLREIDEGNRKVV